MSVTSNESLPPHPPGRAPHYKVVSHSNLFYWWPVWLTGFIMAILSYVDGARLAIVPEGSTVKAIAKGPNGETIQLMVPGQLTESLQEAAAAPPGQEPFPNHITQNPTLDLVYAAVLLLVILASTLTLRGLWSVINLLVLVLLIVLLAHLHWWAPIMQALGQLRLYTNAGGYLFISTILSLLWVVTVFLFDQRRFIIFSPGQLIVHREIGDQQQVYDTGGVIVVKRLNDFTRHRLLGLGAGDLFVSTADGRHQFELPNVLFADRKVREIAELMKTRPVMAEEL